MSVSTLRASEWVHIGARLIVEPGSQIGSTGLSHQKCRPRNAKSPNATRTGTLSTLRSAGCLGGYDDWSNWLTVTVEERPNGIRSRYRPCMS